MPKVKPSGVHRFFDALLGADFSAPANITPSRARGPEPILYKLSLFNNELHELKYPSRIGPKNRPLTEHRKIDALQKGFALETIGTPSFS